MMSYLLFFVEGVLPYLAIAIFVFGSVYRLWRWLTTPVPLRITLSPAKLTWRGVIGKIAAEVLLFISLLKSDKFLWIIAWTMHVFALVVLLGTHFFGLVEHGFDLWTDYTIPQGKAIIYVAATFAFPLIVTLLVLLLKRALTRDIRRISIPTDYIAISLVLFHVINGTYMSFFAEVDMTEVMQWGLGLMNFQPHVVEGSWLFALHTTTAFALFIYFPFSKLFHPLGQVANRWTLTQKEEELVAGGRVVK